MHYTAFESKRGNWALKEQGKGIPIREWDREMELREDIYDGQPVYADYYGPRHCPSVISAGLEPVRGSAYIGGWDGGNSLTPAFVLLQITPNPYQVHALFEITSNGNEPMSLFAPRVVQNLQKVFPFFWGDINHYGDTTIGHRGGQTGETAQQTARRLAHINIVPISNTLSLRVSAVTELLTDMIDERTPRFLICPRGCPVLLEGFQGAYRMQDSAKGETTGPGRVQMEPLKNGYSHVHDALQYASIEALKEIGIRIPGRIRKMG